MGLLGWSDDSTLLFLDPETKFLQQTSVDGQTRRYLPLPPGLNAYGYLGAALSPDRSLLAVSAEPFARDNVLGSYLLVLSAVDGTLVRDFGVHQDGVAWTGDGRLVVRPSAGAGYVALAPRSGESTRVAGASALTGNCGFVSWYEAGRILLGKLVTSGDTGRCVPSATFDVDTAESSPFSGSYRGFDEDLGVWSFPRSRNRLTVERRWWPVRGSSSWARSRAESAVRSARPGDNVGVGWAHPTGGQPV